MHTVCACLAVVLLAACGGQPPAPPAPSPASFQVRGRWADPHAITYRIEADPGPLAVDDWQRACERALAAWSATGAVTFTAAAAGEPADVTLGFRRGHHGACEPFGATRAVAHSGPAAPGTFVHFDAGRPWSADGAAGNSLRHTAMHELGHVLGLGHSETPGAVMSTGDLRRDELAPCDLAGLHSLYGGGNDASGDLAVRRPDGAVTAVLRRVAPPERTAWAVFDTEGDGRCELLVWRTDRVGHGSLMIYGFDARARLARTSGPWPGFCGQGMTVGFAATPTGERLAVGVYPNGRRSVRRFDARGLLQTRGEQGLEPAWLQMAAAGTAGDVDGDGVDEQVGRN